MAKKITPQQSWIPAVFAASLGLALAVPAHAQSSLVTATFTGRIRASACSVLSPSINVPLGTHATGDFGAAIGSTVTEAQFKLGIRCPSTEIQVLVTPSASNVVNAAAGVIGVTGGATGVGIQLLNTQRQPLRIGTADNHGSGHASNWDVVYYARYYRTASTIGTGDANGSATFTITYR